MAVPFILGLSLLNDHWMMEAHEGYSIYFTNSDADNLKDYAVLFENGRKSVVDFFGDSFQGKFDINVHPNRASLDSTWQKDWNMPGFKSQCWMVASGVSDKLDVLSPKTWKQTACEHDYADSTETQRLITHELVHVFHGQLNISPDFSDVHGIDWFVEGLATYASGQCDETRISEVQMAVRENNFPQNLSYFWTGNLRYGLSGSMVMYLDKTYGRDKITDLLKFNTLSAVLESLGTSESEILNGWKSYMLNR